MKKYVYVVYEVYTKDCMEINNLTKEIQYLATYETEHEMISCVESELITQCEDNEGWSFRRVVDNKHYRGIVFLNGEEQYRIIGKEVELVK